MKVFIAALFLTFSVACSQKPEDNILPEKQMGELMWDMMQVDEFATSFVSKDTALVLKNERLKLYKDVFRIHKISKQTFSNSYKYYSGRPDLMKNIFDSLTARGERERKLLYKPKDSIAK